MNNRTAKLLKRVSATRHNYRLLKKRVTRMNREERQVMLDLCRALQPHGLMVTVEEVGNEQ